ncbi:GMC family oxidoreductase N-terminal domain-containing protein [Streptomyces thermocarboxydus]
MCWPSGSAPTATHRWCSSRRAARTGAPRSASPPPSLFGTSADWGYRTTPQPGLGGRTLNWPRGRTLGGSSSLNAQIWTRGHLADFDGWAEDDGCAGWSAGEVLPYFARAEDRSGAGAYGSGGPIRIEDLRDPSPATAEFLGACAEADCPPWTTGVRSNRRARARCGPPSAEGGAGARPTAICGPRCGGRTSPS